MDTPVERTRLEYLEERWFNNTLTYSEVGEYIAHLRAELAFQRRVAEVIAEGQAAQTAVVKYWGKDAWLTWAKGVVERER